MTQQEFLPETNVISSISVRGTNSARSAANPCAVHPGLPGWPQLGERSSYSGSGTGGDRFVTTFLPAIEQRRIAVGEPVMHRTVNSRVHLTELRPTDRSALLEYLNDNDIHRFTCRIPHPYTDESFDEWMEIVASATQRHGEPINWAIRDRAENLIGGIGFDNLTKGHRAEIGYWMAKPFWGQGIMSSVVRAACQVAVSEWKLARITAIVFVDNQASVRVLEKNGFQHEALLRKYFKRDGQFSDALLYARVAE